MLFKMKIKYILLFLITVLTLSACDDQLDITPKGKTILDKTADLEKLLNQNWDLGDPGPLCLVVNECYPDNDVPTVLSQKNTLNYALLTYDETADRASVTATDEIYSSAYQNIFNANTILVKADASEGEDTTKTLIKAEAHILRAYMHYILVNIYAPQYDAATASQQSGVPYREDIDTHAQPRRISVAEDYEKILADLSDDYILALPDKAQEIRGSKAWGYAVKAKVLMQMKEYDKALPYALKALEYNGTIADRTSIMSTNEWVIDEIDPSNIMYINHGMGKPWSEYLTKETVAKFEDGDITINDAQVYGDPLWDSYYGEMLSGVEGCKECQSYDLYWNNWGITSDRMYYVAAECYIRTGQIQKGLDLINKVREKRIEPDAYKPFTASTEQDAMTLLQRAKFIECLATYDNFFDRKRWNTEADYKETLTRHITLKQSGKTMEFSIAPDSKLWIFPFPLNATRNNPNLTQNY